MKRAFVAAAALAVVLVAAGPAAAKGPPVVVTVPPFTFPDVNPCTGVPHDVTIALTLRIHEFELTDPERHHFNIQFYADIATSDGFSGRGTGPDIDNGAGLFGAETGGMFTSIIAAQLRNPTTGQKFRVNGNFHFTDRDADGIPEAFVDHLVLDCLGRNG